MIGIRFSIQKITQNNIASAFHIEHSCSMDDLPLKKKKKKKTSVLLPDESSTLPMRDDDDDYTYQELLHRCHTIPTTKTILRVPIVVVRSKMTSFVNFEETHEKLHRQPEHLKNFLCTELSTTGSIDENGQLMVKGRFKSENFQKLLRVYVEQYILCATCKSSNTTLSKENRLQMLQCHSCGSKRCIKETYTSNN